jgi:hypothetical protein
VCRKTPSASAGHDCAAAAAGRGLRTPRRAGGGTAGNPGIAMPMQRGTVMWFNAETAMGMLAAVDGAQPDRL